MSYYPSIDEHVDKLTYEVEELSQRLTNIEDLLSGLIENDPNPPVGEADPDAPRVFQVTRRHHTGVWQYEDAMGVWEWWDGEDGTTVMRRLKRCGHTGDYVCTDHLYPGTYEKLPTFDRIIKSRTLYPTDIDGPWRWDGSLIRNREYYRW